MSDRRTRNAPVLSERRDLPSDRRSAPRYLSNCPPALIGWFEGAEHRSTPARLIDISMGGFSASVESFPPRGMPVWLRLDGENPSPWLKASVVATIKSGCLFWTRRRARFRFLETCTYDFFKAAVEGFTFEAHPREQPFEGFDSRYWR